LFLTFRDSIWLISDGKYIELGELRQKIILNSDTFNLTKIDLLKSKHPNGRVLNDTLFHFSENKLFMTFIRNSTQKQYKLFKFEEEIKLIDINCWNQHVYILYENEKGKFFINKYEYKFNKRKIKSTETNELKNFIEATSFAISEEGMFYIAGTRKNNNH